MAGRNALRNQGLTKEYIKNLKRFNYQGNNLIEKDSTTKVTT